MGIISPISVCPSVCWSHFFLCQPAYSGVFEYYKAYLLIVSFGANVTVAVGDKFLKTIPSFELKLERTVMKYWKGS